MSETQLSLGVPWKDPPRPRPNKTGQCPVDKTDERCTNTTPSETRRKDPYARICHCDDSPPGGEAR